tara:strand:+ start:6624 stop:7610 length:987 start_codon:yes stop_codon:yes gene_type:complete
VFKNKKILITGGTGSLGQALTKRLLQYDVDTIRLYSRDELKQTQMSESLDDPRLRFLVGDIRDKERLSMSMHNIDIVFHTAAIKHVPIAEYNPFEAIKTNVVGSQNVVWCCLQNKVKQAIAIGTDKAVSPLNTYGATKLLMEKIFASANFYAGFEGKFLSVRYGNVLGSRGSILPKFLDSIKKRNEITITDPAMTRFNITMNQATDLIFRALKHGRSGDIFVPKLKSYSVETMKDAILELSDVKNINVKKISKRPGEKDHEMLLIKDEIINTTESSFDYIISNPGVENIIPKSVSKLKNTTLKDNYSSDTVKLLSKSELKSIITSNIL